MSLTDEECLAALIESRAVDPLRTRRHSCLIGYAHGCNVTIQAHGMLAYTLGDFVPVTTSADAIDAWAAIHAEIETGQVPYRQWPEPVKGLFVTRYPHLPTRDRLRIDSGRLDRLMEDAGAQAIGGTRLFRLYEVDDARAWSDWLALDCVWPSVFPYSKTLLRLGFPAPDRWPQLESAL